jgi:serine/threonine protein kinase
MADLYGGRWKNVGDLGSGYQSRVFRVEDTKAEHPGEHALKRLTNAKQPGRFRSELEACLRLNHPNVVKVIDHSDLDADGSTPYLVMPLAAGGNLVDRVHLYKDSLDSTLIVARQLAEALRHAHANNVIHRDVKPANILFRAPDSHDVILGDFGICLIKERPRETEDGVRVGARFFMAPELEKGGQLEVTAAADVYSLGKVIYYMLSGGVELSRERHGEPEFDLSTNRGGRYQLLFLLLDKMLTTDPATRHQSTDDVIQGLDSISRWEQSTVAVPQSTREAYMQLLQQERQMLSSKQAFEQGYARLQQRIRAFDKSCVEWLNDRLSSLAASFNQPGMFEFSATQIALPALPEQLRGARGYSGAVALIVRRVVTGTEYWLGFAVGGSHRSGYSIMGNVFPPPPTDAGIALMPFFKRGEKGTTELFSRKEQVEKEQAQSLVVNYAGQPFTLEGLGTLNDWPNNRPLFEAVVGEAIDSFMAIVTARP